MPDRENTERLLGRLLESAERNTSSLDHIQARLDDIAPLTELFAAHEKQDTQRHVENLGRFDALDHRLGLLEKSNDTAIGTRRGVAIAVAAVGGLGGGGAMAGVAAFLRKIGWI